MQNVARYKIFATKTIAEYQMRYPAILFILISLSFASTDDNFCGNK